MAKKINKQLVGALTAGSALVLIGAGFVALKTLAQHDPAPHIQRAEQFYKDGKLQSAVQSYVRAFNFDPNKDTGLLVKAASIAWEMKDLGGTRSLCEKAITTGDNIDARGLLLQVQLETSRIFGGQEGWRAAAEQAEKILPSNAEELARFEKEHAELAARARFARGMYGLIRAQRERQPTEPAIEDLRRVVFTDAKTGQPPLDPSNIEAAEALRDYWAVRGSQCFFDKVEDPSTCMQYLNDIAAMVSSVLAACEKSGTPLAGARARMLQLIRFNKPVNMPADKLPPPMLAWNDNGKDSRSAVEKLLEEIEQGVADAEARSDAEVRQTARDIVRARIQLATLWTLIDRIDRRDAVLRAGVERHPGIPDGYQSYGSSLLSEGKIQECLDLYADAIKKLEPGEGIYSGLIKDARALIYDQLVMLELSRREPAAETQDEDAAPAASAPAEGIETAEAWAGKARDEFGAEFVVVKLINGRILRHKRQNAAAISVLEDADKAPIGAVLKYEIKSLLADLYMKQGFFGLVEEACDVMRQIRPRSPAAYMMAAQAQLRQNKPNEALSNLNIVLEGGRGLPVLAPEGPPESPIRSQALSLRATAYQGLKMWEEANADLRRIKQDGAAKAVLVQQAVLDADRGEFEQAATKLKSLLEQSPADVYVLRLLSQVFTSMKKPQEIKPFVQRALEAEPKNSTLRSMVLYLDESLTDEQRDEKLLALIDEQPAAIDRLNSRAEFFISRDRLDEAAAALDEAAKLAPESKRILEQRFVVALRRGQAAKPEDAARWKSAEEMSQIAAKLNADEANGKVYAGRLLLSQAEVTPSKDEAARNALYEKSVQQLREGLRIFPSSAMGWTYLGQSYLGLGNVAEARIALQKAIEIQPNNGWAHWSMASICQRMGEEEAMRRHVKAAAGDPRLAGNTAVAAAVRQIEEEDNPETGIEQREKIRAEKPEDTANLMRLAVLYEKAKRFDDAEKAMTDARKVNPDQLELSLALAGFYMRRDDPGRGVKLLEEQLTKATDDKTKLTLMPALAQLYERADDPAVKAKAGQLYQDAFQLDKNARAAVGVAQYMLRQSQLKEALGWYQEASKLAEKDDPQLFQRIIKEQVVLNSALKDLDQAEKLAAEYSKINPDDPDALVLEARIATLKGDYERALDRLSENLVRQPDNAGAYWQRGLLYAITGDLRRAVEDLSKARDYGPGPPRMPGFQHRIQLSQCLATMGRMNEAAVELRNTLDDANKLIDDTSHADGVANAAVAVLEACNPPRETEAENILLEMANRYTKNPIWPYRLGMLQKKRGDMEAAQQRILASADLSLEQIKSAQARLSQGDNEAAQQAYQTAINNLITALVAAVELYDQQKQYGKIVELLTSDNYSRIAASVPLLKVDIALAQWKLGKQDEGWTAFMEAATQSAGTAPAFRATANRMIQGLGGDAFAARLDTERKAKPDDPVFAKLTLLSLLEQKNMDEAEAIAKTLLESGKTAEEKAFPLASLAAQHYLNKNYEAAAETYRLLLEHDPENRDALNNLSWILAYHLKRPGEALPYADKVVNLDPENPVYLDTLGYCQAMVGKYREARGTLFRCLRLRVDYVPGRLHMGLVYKLEGKKQDAERNLLLAREMAKQQRDTEYTADIDAALLDLGIKAAG